MGTDRDAGKNAKKKSWRDDDVCKHYLVWECPHDFFLDQAGRPAATSPLGPCKRQHLDAMKDRFERDKEAPKLRRRYLSALLGELRRLVADVDARLQHDKNRLRTGTSCSKETADAVGGGAV
eukprot:CAMPEP_0115721140 /NCGR_PEP_ID=MMETSP0272-20121206/78932_1 /TAXON_ID=71861 /ORGANISM="Scrippsiella trochoidea, Strain CCMP3099" /LENGTH=121 /DNA_ID=CAMNT_0003163969 /DNA_START=36 /DNA_END=398 /DNA_ORIENTATION=-